MPEDDWRERRADAATERAAALDRARAKETVRARELISAFLEVARERGLEPEPLRARSYDGRRRYRTGLTGWYLRANETVGVDTEGRFYLLSVPAGSMALLRGVTLEESDPPMVLGRGARDGESIDLADALRRVLGD
ncbi:hypothetical protein OEB99_07105 [Actinotalea sp. M2MS4P-6]|uniref:hypothetical protein n=1 Tax=Actinotalea sp. M2MS4P-6 TaxID=2983762 RepID=UPI0021E3F3E4|nr:hypothetical protein [Actinotalea sp. M2MS4P-6]MCV2394069.1 hypothetical protein [Actinotalea sp. M2MS4P-6]